MYTNIIIVYSLILNSKHLVFRNVQFYNITYSLLEKFLLTFTIWIYVVHNIVSDHFDPLTVLKFLYYTIKNCIVKIYNVNCNEFKYNVN